MQENNISAKKRKHFLEVWYNMLIIDAANSDYKTVNEAIRNADNSVLSPPVCLEKTSRSTESPEMHWAHI